MRSIAVCPRGPIRKYWHPIVADDFTDQMSTVLGSIFMPQNPNLTVKTFSLTDAEFMTVIACNASDCM